MSKESKKMYQHAHSTRDQTKQGIQALFQKKKEDISAIDLQQARVGPAYQKER